MYILAHLKPQKYGEVKKLDFCHNDTMRDSPQSSC